MAETAAHLVVDRVIPRVAVKQWVLSFPIRLRVLFAAHPELLTLVMQSQELMQRLSALVPRPRLT